MAPSRSRSRSVWLSFLGGLGLARHGPSRRGTGEAVARSGRGTAAILLVCVLLAAGGTLALDQAQQAQKARQATATAEQRLAVKPMLVGTPAPDFTLSDLSGKPVALSDFRGWKPVVLVFGSFT